MSWNCEAYGEGGRAVGATCFFAKAGACTDADQCHTRMAAERSRVFTRINQLAVDGDEDMAFLAEVFARPDQLLDGG